MPICVCSLGRMGKECYALFNPCSNIRCENDAVCIPLDERLSPNFICVCQSGSYGIYCELSSAYINIHFSKSLVHHNRPVSATVFIHFLQLRNDLPGVLFIQNRLLHKHVQLNKPLRVFNYDHQYLPPFILLQIFFEPHNFRYYIAAILKNQVTSIDTVIDQKNRCSYVNELLRNRTIREFPLMRKVKYYRYACEISNDVNCFYDEAHLCFCDKDRLPQRLIFQQESTQCTTNYCQNNGQCMQNNFKGIWDFGCVCSECAYGSLCQLTTSQYVLSLDVMLGRDILANAPLTQQPVLIKIMFIVIIVMLSFGFLLNVLSLITFRQPRVQEFGCGIYFFYLPIVDQLGLLIFAGRFYYLLSTLLYNVNSYPFTLGSCIGLEYFLNVCPMLFDWLTACIAIERSVNVIKGVSFNKTDSVHWAKRITLLLPIVVLSTGWHDFFIHQLIDDPRTTTVHTWCVIKFRWPWLKYYRLTINLINLIIPGFINLIATIFLLHKSTRMKQAFGKNKSEKTYFATLKKQLPFYGSPLGLVCLSLLRLIYSFTLVCIIYQWQKYMYLTAYLITFVPLICTFPIFVLPAGIYKTEFKKISRQLYQRLMIRHS